MSPCVKICRGQVTFRRFKLKNLINSYAHGASIYLQSWNAALKLVLKYATGLYFLAGHYPRLLNYA